LELRVHPQMKWEGYSSWPLSWGGAYGRGDIFPGGEERVLRPTGLKSSAYISVRDASAGEGLAATKRSRVTRCASSISCSEHDQDATLTGVRGQPTALLPKACRGLQSTSRRTNIFSNGLQLATETMVTDRAGTV
jgi:hypothetical protein